MIELNVQQGTREWLNARAKCRTASEAPAMMGVSQYKTRTELIAEKATGIIPEVDAATQARFDMGHDVEAMARPLVEQIIGEELYPVVATDDTGKYLASSDGATMLMDVGFEHKAWNEAIAAEVREGNVPESHRWQLDHQFLVFGFEKILFVVSNGTAEKMVYCWYYPQPERIAALVAGWEQFAKDVAAYVPAETKEMPKADVTVELPALFVHAKGEITTHNMDEFGKALTTKLAEMRSLVLVTDQDFSNAKEAAKKFRETAKAIALSKEQMLAQTETIGEAARKMDAWVKDLNTTALQMEKDVEREDRAKKENMVLAARGAYTEHVAALEAETAPIRLNLAAPEFAEAIKGKRNYASMQEAVNTMLAGAKIKADAAAKDVRGKLAVYNDQAAGHGALFPDLQQIITKPMDDFALLVSSRIAQAKAAEEKRLEQERERIRAEEQAKAQREAQAEANRIAAEEIRKFDAQREAQAEAQAEANRIAAEEIRKFDAQRKEAQPAPVAAIEPAANDCSTTIKLGEICARLGFTVTADFLAGLGVHPVATEKNAKLYDEAKFPTICRLIADHILAQAFKKAA